MLGYVVRTPVVAWVLRTLICITSIVHVQTNELTWRFRAYDRFGDQLSRIYFRGLIGN